MARPPKKTIDYFPHIIKKGKTMTILENKYGNDGYAFWFKLLEILGSTDGHYYVYDGVLNKEFLHAETRLDEVTVCSILDLLANLNAIDQELWSKKIIWSDNFVENISCVYIRRTIPVPQKPDPEGVSVNRNSAELSYCMQPDDRNRQSRVEYTRVNKEREGLKKKEKSVSFSDPLFPEAAKPKKERVKIPYQEIVEYLNQKCDTSFRADSTKTRAMIKARYNQKFTLDDFKKVIDAKYEQWHGNDEMARFLRPETLFGSKFESYLQEYKTAWYDDKEKLIAEGLVLSDAERKELGLDKE